jgi:hypothetical protein
MLCAAAAHLHDLGRTAGKVVGAGRQGDRKDSRTAHGDADCPLANGGKGDRAPEWPLPRLPAGSWCPPPLVMALGRRRSGGGSFRRAPAQAGARGTGPSAPGGLGAASHGGLPDTFGCGIRSCSIDCRAASSVAIIAGGPPGAAAYICGRSRWPASTGPSPAGRPPDWAGAGSPDRPRLPAGWSPACPASAGRLADDRGGPRWQDAFTECRG